MSMSRTVGRGVLVALFAWLVANGGIIIRPAKTLALLAALFASIARACNAEPVTEQAHVVAPAKTTKATTSIPTANGTCEVSR
jgi:hypothetical protein